MGCSDLVDFDGEPKRPPDRCPDLKAGSAAGGHRQIGGVNVGLCVHDPLGSGQSRPPPRPLVDLFQNRPHRFGSGVGDPAVVEMEGCGLSGLWGHMIVAHGTTVV